MRNPSTRPDGHLQQRVQKASGPYGGALLPGLRLLRPEASRLVVGTRPSWVDHCYFLERTVTFKLPGHRPEFCTGAELEEGPRAHILFYCYSPCFSKGKIGL